MFNISFSLYANSFFDQKSAMSQVRILEKGKSQKANTPEKVLAMLRLRLDS
jgi:hypothetical protein